MLTGICDDISNEKSQVLQTTNRLLNFKQSEKIDGIKELAKEIGKHGETKEQKSAKKQRTYRGNIIGLEFSNDVNRILPSEFALLMNEETELLFYKKFAEKN